MTVFAKSVLTLVGSAALLTVAVQAQASSLLTNGGFETPDTGSVTYYINGSTQLTGWTPASLPGATVKQVQLTDNAAYGALGVVGSEGSQFLDLTGVVGRGAGVVSDGFATLAGASYSVAFDVGAFFVGGQGSFGDVTIDLYVDNLFVQSFTNFLSLSTAGSDLERYSHAFIGTGNAMTVGLFSSLSLASSDLGVGLDNVTVEQLATPPSAVPEPASWAMMIGGLGLAGVALRARRVKLAFA